MSDKALVNEPASAAAASSAVAKIGAGLFGLWGVLHLWVGGEGLHQYVVSPVRGLWGMFIGGRNAPAEAFGFPVDRATANAQAHIVLNFCFDVAGYGLLGIVVAWQIYRRGSWTAYLIGAVIIGICDLSFLFLQVTSGVIAPSLPSLSGPVLWFLAVCTTPFGLGLPRRRRSSAAPPR